MLRVLFLIAISLVCIGPVIVPFNVFSNINYGDFLLLALFPLFMFRGDYKVRVVCIFPLLFMLIYMLASSYALFFLEFVNEINLGFVLRFFYYFVIVFSVSKFVVDQQSFVQVCKAILSGLTITLVFTWLVWNRTPVYLGSIPMLHTVHDFSIFSINRNYIGFFISLGAGLSFSLIFADTKDNKIMYSILLSFFLLSSILTFSKGAWLSSFILPVVYCIRRKPILASAMLLVTLVVVLYTYNSGSGLVFDLIDKMTNRVESSGNTNNDRFDYAIEALLIGLTYFPFGVGAEGYLDAAIYNGFHPTRDPHNAILWVFAESGIVGLILFCSVLGFLASYIYKFAKRSEGVLLLGLFAPLVLNIPFQGTPFSMKYLWVILGLAASLRYIAFENNSTHYYRASTSRSRNTFI